MTKEAQRIAIAKACGQADRWVLLKRGLYWRPNAGGYTSHLSEAWILTEGEAEKYVYPHDEPVTKKRAPLPDYLNDLNAMHEAEWADGGVTVKAMRFWLWHICDEMTGHSASAAQRAEAFLRAKGLWVEEMVEVSAGK